MAKFKVGERARYVSLMPSPGIVRGGYVGKEVTIVDPLGSAHDFEGEAQYGCQFDDGVQIWAVEGALEKLQPKHQKDDLKAAEPLFIQTQLNRWLGQEEKKSEPAKS